MTQTISASLAQKRFGEMVDAALREPVTIQRHGRDVVTMIAADEYHRLRSLERQVLSAGEVDDETLRLIALAEHDG